MADVVCSLCSWSRMCCREILTLALRLHHCSYCNRFRLRRVQLQQLGRQPMGSQPVPVCQRWTQCNSNSLCSSSFKPCRTLQVSVSPEQNTLNVLYVLHSLFKGYNFLHWLTHFYMCSAFWPPMGFTSDNSLYLVNFVSVSKLLDCVWYGPRTWLSGTASLRVVCVWTCNRAYFCKLRFVFHFWGCWTLTRPDNCFRRCCTVQ
jgi:hypothetical protein